MQQGWLFTVEARQNPVGPGEDWELWTEPPLDRVTQAIRRRSDGKPYTPAWKPGDGIVMYHPQSGRCIALLKVTSDPQWSAAKELFYLETEVVAWDDAGGPSLGDIGVEKALQGGRRRLSSSQYREARRRLTDVGLGR